MPRPGLLELSALTKPPRHPDRANTGGRGVIINMSKVLRFEGDCIEMLDGTHLPVRQKDKNSLLAQFTQYQFRGMQREF